MVAPRSTLLQGIENHLRVLGCEIFTRVELDTEIERLMPLLDGATDERLSGVLSGAYAARNWWEAVEVMRKQ